MTDEFTHVILADDDQDDRDFFRSFSGIKNKY